MQGGRSLLSGWVREHEAPAALPGESRALLFLLALTCVMSLLWAATAHRVPDEMSYFNEILELATAGETAGHSGHVVGVFAWLGVASVKAFGFFGASPLLAVRLMGVLSVVVVGALAYWTARLAMPAWPFARLAIVPLVTLNPMFTFMGASANSDSMLNVWAALLFAGLVGLLRKGPTGAVVFAAVIGLVLGALTKERIWVLAPLIVLALLFYVGGMFGSGVLRKNRAAQAEVGDGEGFWSRNPSGSEMVVVGALIIAAGLFVPRVFGYLVQQSIPLASGPFPRLDSLEQVWAWLQRRGGSWLLPTAWANFGYLDVLAPRLVYRFQHAVLVLGTGSLVLVGLRETWESVRGRRLTSFLLRPGLHISVLSAVAIVLVVYFVAQYEMVLQLSSQGRYLFIASVPVAILLLRGLFGLVPHRVHAALTCVITLALLAVNWYCLFYVVIPHYY